MAVLAASSLAFTGCDEDLELPPMSIPSTDVRANMTILDFKEKYWSDENNYFVEIPKGEDGEDIILGGRIIANDDGGNIYQNVVLQDETGAVCIAVVNNSNDGLAHLYTKYKVGGEMYINVSGLAAGKYAGLFQIGTPGDYNGTPQTSKMSATDYLAHTFLNGLPEPSKVNTLEMTIPEINQIRSAEDLRKYQSQRVRINNVSWIGGGTETWGETGTTATASNRYLIDADGNQILARNSNRSDFCDKVLPAGHGDVIGILSYFNGTWQFMFQNPSDCIDFGGESYAPQIEGEGTAESPFTVGSVIAGATGSDKWVTGYIVGWVEGQAYATGAHFGVPATVASNILLAATPTETNPSNCIPLQLPSGSAVRTALNLQNNPANLGKQVSVKGSLETYFGMPGLKSVSLYAWGDKGDESGNTPGPDVPADGGTADNPFKVSQILSGAATGNGVWLTAYIVGAVNDKSLDTAGFTAPFSLNTNILVAENPGETDIAKCVPVQLPSGTVRTELNLVENVNNLGKQVTLKGDVATYFGVTGFKSVTAYAWGDKGSAETPVVKTQFRKAAAVTSGKQYILVAEGKMAIPGTGDYGYLKVTDVIDNGGVIDADDANAFTFNAVSGGYNIIMPDGRYLYQKDSYNSFNFSNVSVDGDVWTVEAQSDGSFKITNVAVGKYIQYSSQYTSYGSYSTANGSMPVLYEKVN